MSLDSIPILLVLLGTIAVVMASIEAGFQLGLISRRRSEDEKEAPVSAMTSAVLGLTAFMLAITFGMVADRYDARKGLVREEANAIGTAYLRTDFLSEPERAEAKVLLKEYVELRLNAAQSADFDAEVVENLLAGTGRMQDSLWEIAVANARKDADSDVAALYIESINEVIDVHALRVAVGLQSRIPWAMWIVLFGLAIFGMMGVGYQTGIAGSKRSWGRPILAMSFSMVVTLIALLDRPDSAYLRVSQQPLSDLREMIASHADGAGPPDSTAAEAAIPDAIESDPARN